MMMVATYNLCRSLWGSLEYLLLDGLCLLLGLENLMTGMNTPSELGCVLSKINVLFYIMIIVHISI